MHSSKTRHIGVVALLIGLAVGAHAQQRRTYPTGTAFEENFGNVTTNPDSCWTSGPVSCDQLWTQTAGTGAAIVSAPSGWTGSALELPSGATRPALEAIGTIPTIPANTGLTLTATVEISAFDSGFTNILELSDVANNQEVSIAEHATGFYEGGGSPCTAAAGAVHTLKVVINGASSQFLIDGVQCGADFSDPGDAPYRLILYGGTDFSTYWQQVTISGATVSGGWPPSALLNFAGQSGVPTATTLAAGTQCGSGSYSEAGSSVTFAFDSTASLPAFAANESVCGTNYAGNSGVALKATWSPTASATSWDYVINTSYTTIAVGFAWKTDAPNTVSFTDVFSIDSALFFHVCGGQAPSGGSCSGTPGYVQNTDLYVCGEQADGTTPLCAAISANVWYWVTIEETPSGSDDMRFYTYPALALVVDMPLTGNTISAGINLHTYSLGDRGSEQPGVSFDCWYGNVLPEYADAQFPVLPPSAAGACTLSLLGVGPC